MIVAREVGEGLWLAIAPALVPGPVPPAGRLGTDRAAADRAQAAALDASARGREESAVSRSHTEGIGAALVGPASTALGVDLISPARVTRRHAREIMDAREWKALAGYGAHRAALAWALKEAAAKATGQPSRWFPAGLRVDQEGDRLAVRRADSGSAFAAGWIWWGSYLCAWACGQGPVGDLLHLIRTSPSGVEELGGARARAPYEVRRSC